MIAFILAGISILVSMVLFHFDLIELGQWITILIISLMYQKLYYMDEKLRDMETKP